MATAKQIAARKKFTAMVKARAAKKKTSSPKTKTKKVATRNSRVKKGAKAHPGLKAAAKSIASKKGFKPKYAGQTKMQAAEAILAAGSRNASPKAKRVNTRLKKVKGK